MSQTDRILIAARGSRALEERLLEDLVRMRTAQGPQEALLAAPVLLVVSSEALRRHLVARIAQRLGPSVMGVAVHTFGTIARLVLERAGHPPAAGGALFDVIVHRSVAVEPELESALGTLEDGHGVVSASVKDLLSAGFEPTHADACLESIQGLPGSPVRSRAAAVLRCAAGCSEALDAWKIGRMNEVLRDAAREIETRGSEAVGAEAVIVYGFSDATGRGLDLLQALVSRCGARVYIDLPPDPATPHGADKVNAFTEKFRERVVPGAGPRTNGTPQAPTICLFNAPGTDGEIFEVTHRIRALLAAGARPESVGVVARSLAPYAAALRRHFGSLGVPFSGGRVPAGWTPLQRRLVAGVELLTSGAMATIDRWLDAWAHGFDARLEEKLGRHTAISFQAEDLRLGLRAIGVARVGDAASLDADQILGGKDTFLLPVRRGFSSPEEDADDDAGAASDPPRPGTRAERRLLPAAFLQAALSEARRLASLQTDPGEQASLSQHVAHARAFFEERLGWDADGGGDRRAWEVPLEALSDLDGHDDVFSRAEFLQLLSRGIQTAGEIPLGGHGGGVQLYEVARSRYLTFEHLFVLGLNRNAFPRVVSEDPLLPDQVRRALRDVLPDLHTKQRGHAEERYLFSQLMASAANVTLSWQRADDDGKQLHPSSFVERLVHGDVRHEPASVPRRREDLLQYAPAGSPERPRTARENLQLAGIAGTRELVGQLLPLAVEDGREHFGSQAGSSLPDPVRLGAARLRILDEFDPDLRTPQGRGRRQLVSPYLGTIAAMESESDPRAGPLHATRLESLAVCPWRMFLERVLRLEPTPDPLGALPGLDQRLLGITVHDTLQQLVEDSLPARPANLVEALESGPTKVTRPESASVRGVLQEVATRAARKDGLLLPGLHRTLAGLAEPYVIRALEFDWPASGDTQAVLGCELTGEVTFTAPSGKHWVLCFKADRVDMHEDSPRFTDYKTGKPLSVRKQAVTRAKNLREAVQSGEKLQAAIYALAGGSEASGRYLYLEPEILDEIAVQGASGSDEVVTRTLEATLARLIAAWEAGVVFPRLEQAGASDEPPACNYCEVADACLRRDSGARRRLADRAWKLRERRDAGNALSPGDQAFFDAWWREAPTEDEA